MDIHTIIVHIDFVHKSSVKDVHPNTIIKSSNTTLFEDVFYGRMHVKITRLKE